MYIDKTLKQIMKDKVQKKIKSMRRTNLQWLTLGFGIRVCI